MHVLILGPTGTAGSAVLTEALANQEIDRVTTLHRRRTGLQHQKLSELTHTNFTDYSGLEQLFTGIDVCFFCLGISQLKEKDRERFYQITHDYPVALAKSLLAVNPDITFCFLSGQGADPSGKSRVAFAKAKGAAENSLRKLGLKQLYIFRPGYIHPDSSRSDRPFGERISGALYPVLKIIFPKFVIEAKQLAKAMTTVGLHGYKEQLLHNTMIKRIL